MTDKEPRVMSLEDYTAMQKRGKKAAAQRRYTARMAPEDVTAVKLSDADRQRHAYSIMSPEDKDAHLARLRQLRKEKRDAETPEQREARRAAQRARTARHRSKTV